MEQLIGYAKMFWPFIILALIFYFFMYKPQKKHEEERTKFLEALSVGDDVVTAGGIHGVVKLIRETYILLEIAEGVIIQIEKAAIAKTLASASDDEEVEIVEEVVEVEEDEKDDGKKPETEK